MVIGGAQLLIGVRSRNADGKGSKRWGLRTEGHCNTPGGLRGARVSSRVIRHFSMARSSSNPGHLPTDFAVDVRSRCPNQSSFPTRKQYWSSTFCSIHISSLRSEHVIWRSVSRQFCNQMPFTLTSVSLAAAAPQPSLSPPAAWARPPRSSPISAPRASLRTIPRISARSTG